MIALLKLWGIAMVGIGCWCGYRLIDVLFIQGAISTFSEFMIVMCILGLLVSVTLLYFGFKLLTLKRFNK